MSDDDSGWKDRAYKMGEKLRDSTVYAGIVSNDFLKNPTCALQLGFAILMDKPICLIVDKEVKLPANLVKVAVVIERVDTKDPHSVERAAVAIRKVVRKEK